MLRFEWADTVSQASAFAGSQLFQLVSAPGGSVVSATAVFNRVAGDSETDTKFNLILDFFSGAPSSYPSVANDPLERAIFELFSDADPSTWELAMVSLVAPAGSTYVALQVSAGEDIFNDTSGIEFDGHYADAVTLEVVPEPGTASLVALGVIGLAARRRIRRD